MVRAMGGPRRVLCFVAAQISSVMGLVQSEPSWENSFDVFPETQMLCSFYKNAKCLNINVVIFIITVALPNKVLCF